MESMAHLLKELPKDYEDGCIKQGALKRRRGVPSPPGLAVLAMPHLQNGCPLMEMSEAAGIAKLGKMSGVAFMDRFEQCGKWFRGLNEKMAAESIINYEKPNWLAGKTVVAADASDVSGKGRPGRVHRLHYALDIFKMSRVEHKTTTNKTGESLCNFNPQPGQLTIAGRAYSPINGINHCNGAGAEYILRVRRNSFTLKDGNGEKIDLLALLPGPGAGEALGLAAYAANMGGGRAKAGVCAKRKTPEAAAQAQKRLKRKESKKQRPAGEETKTFNGYIVLAANLEEPATAEEVLEACRLRWQAGICFKRLKSILDFGELPERRPGSVIAWLNGKTMVALLTGIAVAKAVFPPQGGHGPERLARNQTRQTVYCHQFL